MSSVNLDKIIVNNNRVDYFFSIKGNLQKYFKADNHMFLEYNIDMKDVPKSILAIPFVSNIIPLIWVTGSTVTVDELDRSFCHCLERIKESFQNMYPTVAFEGAAHIGKMTDNCYTPEYEAASLFSGGLDAVATYVRIRDKKPVLITEYGWHENDIKYSDIWESDKQNAVSFAKSNGLKNILIQSNYGTFIIADNIDLDFKKKLKDSWWHGLHHGLAIISAAIPAAFKLKVNCIYIASSNSPLLKVTCASDPTIDNHIRYASGKVFHDAFELTRQDKVKVVVDYFSTVKEPVSLRVCFNKKENCCNCEKCLRTIMEIVAEGKDPRDFGFKIPNDLSQYVKNFFHQGVQFLPPAFITIYWKIIQNRMSENRSKILFKDLLEWFLDYDFAAERKKALVIYRITKFFPILKRKTLEQINRIRT